MVKILEKVKDLSLIGIVDLSAAAISAIFWFYVASLLGPKDYGEISYIIAIAQIASTVSLLGAPHVLIVYTAKNVRIHSALYALTLLIGTVISIILFLFYYNTEMGFLILGYIIFSLVTSEILGRKLFRSYAKFVLTQRTLMVILGIGLYFILGNNGVIIGLALSFSPYIKSIISGFRKYECNFYLIKERFRFIINSYFEGLSTILSSTLDKLIIASLFGFTLLGNYSLGIQFFQLLLVIPQIVWKYILPYDSIGIENKKLKQILIFVSVGLAILGFIVVPPLIELFFPQYSGAVDVTRIISVAIIPATIFLIYHSKFLGIEKSKYVFISSIILTVVQIIGIIILGSLYQVQGMALAIVLAYTCSVIYMVFQNKLEYRKNPNKVH
ncbi:MAG: lipopolysaccharide biosynthesis protein [Nitrosarchaeum sp.]